MHHAFKPCSFYSLSHRVKDVGGGRGGGAGGGGSRLTGSVQTGSLLVSVSKKGDKLQEAVDIVATPLVA